MKTHKMLIALIPLFAAPLVASASENSDDLAYEPCINGSVSASGLFASQEQEDAYNTRVAALFLEPCINSAVSADGARPSEQSGVAHFAREGSSSARSL